MSKPSFLGYITERLGSVRVTAEPFGNPWKGSRENNSFPEYYAWEASLNLNPAVGAKRVVCDAPLTYKGQRQVAADIATFKAALAKVNVREAFLPAISPSNVEFWIRTSTTNRTKNISSRSPTRCTRNTKPSPTRVCSCKSTIRGW
jgi:hypothetical protein